MKTAIVYASTHHGNTKKLLDAIAAAYEVDLIDAVKIPEKDLNRYDRIGFAPAISASSGCPFARPPISLNGPNVS